MTPEQSLMAKIKATCGSFIEEAVLGTPYPPALLAALTANESDGDPNVTRFESKVFGELAQVLVGKKPNFGSIGGEDLLAELGILSDAKAIVSELMTLATSFGPMQIMGYQSLANRYDLYDLPTLDKHYPHAVAMLEDFRKRFDLVTAAAIPAAEQWGFFFHCWNAGAPKAPTFDPQYTAKGLDRMGIYQAL